MPSLVVIGPGVADADGFRFHVHAAECGDRIKRVYHNIDFKEEWDSPCELGSIQDVILVALGDELAETGTPWEEAEDQVRFFDCVPVLPLESPDGPPQWDDDAPEEVIEVATDNVQPIPLNTELDGVVSVKLPQLALENIDGVPEGGGFFRRGRGYQYRNEVPLTQARDLLDKLDDRKRYLESQKTRSQDEWAELEALRKGLPVLASSIRNLSLKDAS